MIPLLLTLFGCEYGFTLPSTEPTSSGPTEPGTKQLRERVNILPERLTGAPPSDAGITSGQCDDMEHGGEVKGPDCATDVLTCNSTIIGHTRGGVDRYDSEFYESHFCWPSTTDHDSGDERVYQFDLPPNTMADIALDTPCADLDMMVIRQNSDTCPKANQIVPQCEMALEEGKKREQIHLVTINKSRWWVVVEGSGDAEGAYALSVQCRDRP